MRTITKELYKFEELSPEVQQKVIDDNRDWNVDYDWWDFAYDEIAEIWKQKGLGTDDHRKGDSPFYFSLDRSWNFYATGVFVDDYTAFIKALRIDPKGEISENLQDNVRFGIRHFGGNSAKTIVDSVYLDDESEKIVQNFIDALCGDSLDYLQKGYDYLTSDEAIRESIESNGDEFDWEGNPA